MRLTKHKATDGTVTGYIMYLNDNDTWDWANKIGAAWPGSSLAGERCAVYVDSNGLYDLTVNGRDVSNGDIDTTELEAIVSDHLPLNMHHLWPIS